MGGKRRGGGVGPFRYVSIYHFFCFVLFLFIILFISYFSGSGKSHIFPFRFETEETPQKKEMVLTLGELDVYKHVKSSGYDIWENDKGWMRKRGWMNK